MERPFFSLQKRERLKAIEYRSPDGEAWVKVEAMLAYGMATTWNADILIWAASVFNRMKSRASTTCFRAGAVERRDYPPAGLGRQTGDQLTALAGAVGGDAGGTAGTALSILGAGPAAR